MGYRDGLKLRFVKLDALAALRSPASALLGVSDAVELTLKKLGINTIFDLATSSLFITAAEITIASEGQGNSVITRVGRIPGSYIDADSPSTPAALVGADVVMLREIGPALATEIKAQMQVDTVGDLGRWPAFRAAQLILDAAVPTADTNADEASELVPKFGEYPTERHYYRSIVIDHVTPGQTTDLATAGPIDISPTVSADFGFSAPAVGAMLTMAQSWFAQGLTLGNLLHSVALAPGESTRIAVLDWARRTSASGQENITESEQLTNSTTHNRAISEVQNAVAKEVQSGFSKSSGSSDTEAVGGGFGLSLGPLTVGGSGSGASTSTSAESFSSSSGTRNLAASMNQRVSDATQQASSSVRDRRASIVKEVSEEEHQSVSTRIIANYNHMHALTVQYFEVIEIYRVNVQLQQVERCLFVPMKLIKFTDAIIERYQGVLANAAISRRARELLSSEFGTVSLQPSVPMRRCGTIYDRVSVLDRATLNLARATASVSAVSTTLSATEAAPVTSPPVVSATRARILTAEAPLSWINDEVARAARLTMVKVTQPGKSELFLPDGAEIKGITFSLNAQDNSAVSLSTVQLVTPTGTPIALVALSPVDWTVVDSIPMQEINQIRVSSTQASYFTGTMTLQLSYGSARFPITFPVEIIPHAIEQPVCRIVPNEGSAELLIHLEQHRLHYSQAIWRSLDPSSIALLLSAYTFEGMPIADQIDPNPVMVASNYLVFRMPGFVEAVGISSPRREEGETPETIAHKNWQNWLEEHGLILGSDVASEQLVPIPTSGVFAEAVLGRSNSAERLDATRFWNWQDSPIPLQPPEIAAIQMESRAQPIDVTPGHLGAPVLNIMNPTSLPDPAGINSIMGALQNGNMFRDMSGLAATVGLAQALSGNATSASTEAGRQAAANLAVAAQKDIEEKRIAAQVAMAAMGLPAANGGTPKNISESGALLNTAKEMDKQSPKGSSSSGSMGGSSGGDSDGGMSGSSDGGTDGTGDSFDGSFMPGPEGFMSTRADDVLSKMTWGNLGSSGSSLVLATQGKKVPTASIIIFELGLYTRFPRPWADEAAEIQGIQNDKWLPAEEDFDSISPAATSASGSGTKPNGLIVTTLDDILSSVNYFAPQVPGFSTSHPARVKRLNLFFYSGGPHVELLGTLKTSGIWTSVFGPTMDLNASVADVATLKSIRSDAANKARLKKLATAWTKEAEIWLYSAGGVPSDALAQAFAKLMGVKVRAFTEPFWVLPRYDAAQNVIVARDEFGIGADFNAASSTRTKVLHALDSLSTRSFNP
jgi:hypothetical protein